MTKTERKEKAREILAALPFVKEAWWQDGCGATGCGGEVGVYVDPPFTKSDEFQVLRVALDSVMLDVDAHCVPHWYYCDDTSHADDLAEFSHGELFFTR
jgi:hypothetical protein